MRSSARLASGSISLAGSLAGVLSRAASAAASACSALVIFLLGGGDQRGVLGLGGDAGIAQQGGQVLLRRGERRLRGADGGGRGLARRIIDHLGVGFDGGDVVADRVDAVVRGGVLEEVLLPPPGLQPGQDLRRAGGGVGGEDLQRHLAVLEQGDLAGLAVVLQLHGLLGPGDRPLLAAGGDGGKDGQAGRDRERGTAVGDPVHVLVAAVAEHLRVGAAAVKPEHDLRAGPGGLLQLRERRGQGRGQAGRLAGDKADRAAVMGGDVGVGAAFLRPAALVVPALGDRLGARIRHEVIVDVVHAGGAWLGGQHRGGEHRLQLRRVGGVGQRRQPRPQGAQVRQHGQPGQRPGARRSGA